MPKDALIFCAALALVPALPLSDKTMTPAALLCDFARADALDDWFAVNDGVMGGVSEGRIERASGETASFTGTVSLEHGGGFASVRTRPREFSAAGAASLVLRVRGDGRRYKLTARTEDAFDGVQYQAPFVAPAGLWTEIDLPVTGFRASFRGRPVPGAAAFDPARLRVLGLLISDRQAGPFALELRWIGARY